MTTGRTCRLALFTWTKHEAGVPNELVPVCLSYPESNITIASFGTGLIVYCQSGKDLMKLCSREALEAEREEAKRSLADGL